ncbi:MAG: ATP-binding protein [Desulfobacterales bacterium]|jgi:two-component system NtrC family sensor kinase
MENSVSPKRKNLSPHPDISGSQNHHPDTKAYFRQLKWRFRIGLLIAFMVPLVALSVYFHFQFNFTLKQTAKLNLIAISESQKNTVDLFLQERVVNIFSLFHSKEFSLIPSRRTMDNYLQNLRRVSDAFIDVGFLNARGIQIGYAGPFPYLQNKEYTNENWFQALVEQDRNRFISDIYLGFRNKPHFTIAVKQIIDGKLYLMRSTLDPDKFYMFLRTISHGKGVESSLINKGGSYQIVDPDRGTLFGLSDFIPSNSTGTGVQEIKKNSDSILVAYSWLKETPWALIVREPLSIAHAQMYRARRIMIIGIVLLFAIIALAIWITTSKVINRAQENAEKREELHYQLLHASKLASVGELATGVAHEINNPLAIIMASSGVIRDMLNPEFELDGSPENIQKELDTVDSAIFRARGITQQLLNYGRKSTPQPVPCDVNHILDEVISGFKEREFAVSNIKIDRIYDPELPEIQVDPDQIRQVFLNLINNAGDAISGSGIITLSTTGDEKNIRITVTDSGRGMTADQIKKIFDPFYTTKEAGKGTGLGLSVSFSIVKSMGGSIDVQSMPGAGSSFTVVLPIHITQGVDNGA